jgi:2-amino-4-hydroxy-6-hydroxymethyldihydropteridine diphosphokinase
VILIGIGSNLPGPAAATPRATGEAALACFPELGIEVVRRSLWYESEPVPISDQPWFVNGVASVRTQLDPLALLRTLLGIESRLGRHRTVPNAARTLDLDLLDYDGRQVASAELILPHPRLHERRFVLAPLAEIAPEWRHPLFGLSSRDLLERLPPGQPVRVLGDRDPAGG